jgi:hypothetical protein
MKPYNPDLHAVCRTCGALQRYAYDNPYWDQATTAHLHARGTGHTVDVWNLATGTKRRPVKPKR